MHWRGSKPALPIFKGKQKERKRKNEKEKKRKEKVALQQQFFGY